MVATGWKPAAIEAADWLLSESIGRQVPTIREFAESTIVLPDGPLKGEPFRIDTQPYSRLLFEAIQSGRWNRVACVGPTQTGKSLTAYVVPMLWHLFGHGETAIAGLPTMTMANDKWQSDFLPVIEACELRYQLPSRGEGSKGGQVKRGIKFRNGSILRFMAGGGGDKQRAGFTSRVLGVTEVDGLDKAGGTSQEADKIEQLEGRTRSHGDGKMVYLECTVTIESGRIWQEYVGGTQSRIALPCPHCGQFVSPEREHLVGWQEAESELEAREIGHFICPACAHPWTESERLAANQAAVLAHRGQEVLPDGTIRGDPPKTSTLGFRWSAVNNCFPGNSAGLLAAEEWKAARAVDPDLAERKMCQFVWAVPFIPDVDEETSLSDELLMKRTRTLPKGIIPEDAKWVVLGVDLGKRLCHWKGFAWDADASAQIFDYGRFEVASDELGVERAMLIALREFRERVLKGWGDRGGKIRIPEEVWIDSRYQGPVVKRFCRESGPKFRPTMGFGGGDQNGRYVRPARTDAKVRFIGEGYHIAWDAEYGVHVVHLDADHWKTYYHNRLATPVDQPGAAVFYAGEKNEHLSMAKHLTAEKKVEEFVPEKGLVRKWVRLRKNNHWFDAGALGCAAGWHRGARLIEAPPSQRIVRPRRRARFVFSDDGRPYLPTRP